ncbi:MAG: sigma-70 family RNA polymerase sigma factor, partial [Caldilineae bacterium]
MSHVGLGDLAPGGGDSCTRPRFKGSLLLPATKVNACAPVKPRTPPVRIGDRFGRSFLRLFTHPSRNATVPTSSAQQEQEQGWIRQALAGDQSAFANLVEAYQRPVYNLCYRMLGNAEEAQDAAQETFLRCFIHLHRYDPSRKFLNWILSIASNHCVDRLRRRRIKWLSLEDAPFVEQIPAPAVNPQRHVEQNEQAAQVQQWLEQLPPDYRLPLILLYWYGLSYEEIADTLEISVAAVKSRLHRARKKVAELIVAAEEASPASSPSRPSYPLPLSPS